MYSRKDILEELDRWIEVAKRKTDIHFAAQTNAGWTLNRQTDGRT